MFCSGDDDDDEDGSEAGEGGKESTKKVPSMCDYVLHCLSLFWKILFAFVPPTGQSQDHILLFFVLK